MNIVRWIVSLSLLLLSLWAITGNLWITFGGLIKRRKKFESLVPLVGGVVGMAGILLLPVETVRRFWWVPLIADLGCVPLFGAVVIELVRKRFAPTSKK